MKQFVQNYRTGELKLIDTPVPQASPGKVLVENVNSVISIGTEKLMFEFANKSLFGKALARPDLSKKVIELAKAGGVVEAYRQTVNRLDTLTPIGYSCAGVVLQVGENVEDFKAGDRVACARSGFASHSEFISVPANLCAGVPEGVDFESAAFVTPGAISLHAIRLCELSVGDNVAIIGLGLLGQLAVQIAKAAGYKVFGMDTNRDKVSMAEKSGMNEGVITGGEEAIQRAMSFTKGHGFDAAVILASTKSNQPLETAAQICRQKGRIVAPGMVKLDVPRQLFYQKELSLVVSKAWGPGLDDPSYELKGIDYPYHYVRWTEQRNMEQFLDLIKDGKVQLGPLITHRFRIDEAESAYKAVMEDTSGKYIGVLLSYDATLGKKDLTTMIQLRKEKPAKEKTNAGLIGAGNFATTTLLPIIRKMPFVNLKGVATATGASGKHVGERFGFEYCTTDYNEILKDPDIDCVLIATRPNLHGRLVIEALNQGKDVFVEKPLALSVAELAEIKNAYNCNSGRLMVGYNRRFASLILKTKEFLNDVREPLIVSYMINSHPFPKDAYLLDPSEGGGVVKADWGHLIDLAGFIIGSLPVQVYAERLPETGIYAPNENLAVTVKYEDGSLASLTWVANAGVPFIREEVQVFGGGMECTIANFRSLVMAKRGKKKRIWKLNRDVGHRNEFTSFFSVIRKGGEMPVDFREYIYTTLVTLGIEESISTGLPVEIDPSSRLGGQ